MMAVWRKYGWLVITIAVISLYGVGLNTEAIAIASDMELYAVCFSAVAVGLTIFISKPLWQWLALCVKCNKRPLCFLQCLPSYIVMQWTLIRRLS